MAISLRSQWNKPLETPVNIWPRSNDQIKSSEPVELVLLSGLKRRHQCLLAISLRRQWNKPLETPVNIWARSNGRIKSYVPLEPKLLCGPWWCPTRRCGCWVAILVRCQVKPFLETHVKIWARSNGRIKSSKPGELVVLSGSRDATSVSWRFHCEANETSLLKLL
jgi:hypothetical protein